MKETAKAILEQMNFPNQYDVIREEAERFQKLSGIEKLRSIAELMAMGSRMVNNNPQRRNRFLNCKMLMRMPGEKHSLRCFQKYEAKHGSLVS